MKYLPIFILGVIIGIALFSSRATAQFADELLSIDLAPSPSSGYILSTDGTNNSWIVNSGGSGGGIFFYTSATDTIAPIVASSSNTERLSVSSFHATSTATSSTFNLASSTAHSITRAYVTQLANLTSNGFVKTGSSNGTLSIDTTTYESGLTAGDGLTRTANDFDCDTASGSTFGCLSSADWTTFNNKGVSNWLYNGSRLSPSTTVGIGVFASSTIGDGTATGGLTVSGNGTTTGAFKAGKLSSGFNHLTGTNGITSGDLNWATSTNAGAFGQYHWVQGDRSFAFGSTNIVNSADSVVVGAGNEILGGNIYSFVAGSDNIIQAGSAGNNYAFGNDNLLGGLGQYQFAMGNANDLSNARDEVYAFGFDNTVEGFYAGAFGALNSVLRDGGGNTPDGSNAFGYGNTVAGTNSFAFGLNADVWEDNAFALGSNVVASSSFSGVIGDGVDSNNKLINLLGGLYIGYNSTYPTLVVRESAGAGTTGNVGIGTTSPSAKLTVQSRSSDGFADLFRISSSTGSATTTLFKVDAYGTTTMLTATSTSLFAQMVNFGSSILKIVGSVVTALGSWDFGDATALEIPNGTAPTVDAVGEFALDTTANQIKYFSNGITHVLTASSSKSFRVASSTIGDNGNTFWNGTSTINLHSDFEPVTLIGFECTATATGTAFLRFGDGTNYTNTGTCSTSGDTTYVSSNNTFTASEDFSVQIWGGSSTTRALRITTLTTKTAQ